MTRTVQLLTRHDAYTVQLHCPTVLLMLKSWLVIANQIREFCYSYDYIGNRMKRFLSSIHAG